MSTSADRTKAKQAARAEREAQLAQAIRDSHRPAQRRYGIILADPPWKFVPYSQVTGMDRAADNHYPTMALNDIRRLAIPAADDCILFMWRTAPMLMEAISVMIAWSFTYKSEIVWTKQRAGTGYWTRNQHEALIIATRGRPVAPAPGTQPSSWLHADTGAHSVKPSAIPAIIETLYPNTPKVEFFARTQRKGWDLLYSPEATLNGETPNARHATPLPAS